MNENSRFFGRRFESVQSENLDSCAARPEVQYCTIELLAFEGTIHGHHLHDFRGTMRLNAQPKIANRVLCKYSSIIEECANDQ